MVEFECPQSKRIFESSLFTHKNSRHTACIRDHFFNHAVEIFLPGLASEPDGIKVANPDHQMYYIIKKLPLVEIVNEEFIQTFLKTGSFYGLSIGHIDTHSVAAILPTGKLILSVSKDLYEELGLEGKPCQFEKPRKVTKYNVEINLTAESFCKGKKHYERVQWCLKERLDMTFDILLAWQPNDTTKSLDPLSTFWNNKYECHQVEQKQHRLIMRDLTIPVIDSSMFTTSPSKSSKEHLTTNGSGQRDEDCQIRSCEASEVYEWLGAIACECKCSDSCDGFVSNYVCPTPSQKVAGALCQRWTGFITPDTILNMLDALRIEIERGFMPWASLTVHGFQDSPVSWSTKEHGFHKFGDNLYTFFIFPNEQRYWLLMNIGGHDICP
ncbi:ribonuclease P protein subunit p40-like [Asterias rubens]|uniref:ribonuclease P protein subunit p40-like n=1 Tax=Asterias rubens TaxID=7604 RepID=UPI001455AE40|nr:ribonuclease P protein subunit p40-like [Asterias rubens]